MYALSTLGFFSYLGEDGTLDAVKHEYIKVFRLINPTKVNQECWGFVKFESLGGICQFESELVNRLEQNMVL